MTTANTITILACILFAMMGYLVGYLCGFCDGMKRYVNEYLTGRRKPMTFIKVVGENLQMKRSVPELMNDLVDMYKYHYEEACNEDLRNSEDANDIYEVGKHDGAVEAIGSLIKSVFGSKGQELLDKKVTNKHKENDDVL